MRGVKGVFRCKATVLAFTLSVTVMLMLTEFSAPDDKNIGIEYCQNTQQYQWSDINNPAGRLI